LVGPARIQDRKSYQIAVRHQTGVDANGQPWQGEVSSYLHEQLSVGDTVHIGCPKGLFVMPESIDQPVVLIAGGIGITPFLSYLESLAQSEQAPEVWLHYANRNPQSSAYDQRLDQLAQELPTLTIKRYYDTPVPEQGISSRQVNAALIGQDLIDQQARFYICGPKGMMDA